MNINKNKNIYEIEDNTEENLKITHSILISNSNKNTIKFSELTIDTYRMMEFLPNNKMRKLILYKPNYYEFFSSITSTIEVIFM